MTDQVVYEVGHGSLGAAARFAMAVLDAQVLSQGEWDPKLAYTASKYLRENLPVCSRCEGDGSYSEMGICTTLGPGCGCERRVSVDPCPDCAGTGVAPEEGSGRNE